MCTEKLLRQRPLKTDSTRSQNKVQGQTDSVDWMQKNYCVQLLHDFNSNIISVSVSHLENLTSNFNRPGTSVSFLSRSGNSNNYIFPYKILTS